MIIGCGISLLLSFWLVYCHEMTAAIGWVAAAWADLSLAYYMDKEERDRDSQTK